MQITIVNGVDKQTSDWGAPHCTYPTYYCKVVPPSSDGTLGLQSPKKEVPSGLV
jgi:hypothetical protein